MRRRSLPLRVYLLLLVLGAMAPGAVLTAILVAQTFSSGRAVVEGRLLDSARVDAAALDREFEGHIRALEAIATSPTLDSGDLQAFHAEAARVQGAQRGWYEVLLLSPDGQQLVSTHVPWSTPLLSAHEPESLRELIQRQQPVVGRLRLPQRGGQDHVFAVRVPVVRTGALKYALTAVVEAASLSRLVGSSLPVSEEWSRTLLDVDGIVTARTRDASQFVGQPATPSFRTRILNSVHGVFRETAIDGASVYAATARSAFGWTAAIIVPRSVLDAPVRESTISLLAGGALLTIGTLTALLLVSRRLSNDLAAVANAAEAVTEGRPLAAPPAHVSETQRLQESLQTAALMLEKRQRERNEEVQRAQAARRDAEHANQTKDHFLAVLGHELRNPLAPALTALELMKARDPHTLAQERQVLERQVGHMVRLVNDLLDVSRLVLGKVDLRRERFELRNAVDAAVDMARPLIDGGGHAIRLDVPESGLLIDGDEGRLAQVLTNLLTNAAKYTTPPGHISLTARAEGGTIRIACEDDGPGVPPELRPSLFDAFAQGPRTLDRAQGGLGLGLALAKNLTTLHGGSIRLEQTTSGVGSRFVVELPAASGPPAPRVARQPDPRRAAGQPRHVLVVDDNVDACDMLRIAIEGAGHDVSIAPDGPAALRDATAHPPDIGILDIGLPGMNGYELARRLRQDHPRIRLIALTGYGQPSDKQAALAAGFDSHLTKPVELSDLLAQIDDASAIAH